MDHLVRSGKLLLVFAITVNLNYDSRETHDNILLSHDMKMRDNV
jgi:hypothetical protein